MRTLAIHDVAKINYAYENVCLYAVQTIPVKVKITTDTYNSTILAFTFVVDLVLFNSDQMSKGMDSHKSCF